MVLLQVSNDAVGVEVLVTGSDRSELFYESFGYRARIRASFGPKRNQLIGGEMGSFIRKAAEKGPKFVRICPMISRIQLFQPGLLGCRGDGIRDLFV